MLAHAARIATDWSVQVAAQNMGQAALALYATIGQTAPSPPPGSLRGAYPSTVWRLLATAMGRSPSTDRLPATVLARADELDRLLRDARLPAGHPIVRAHAARIVSDSRVQEATELAQQTAKALRAWQAQAKQRQADLDRREQTVEDREAVLARRQAALDAQEAALTERTRVLDAREASLELRERQATEQPSQNRWTRLWTRFTAWFWS
ncbi:MAG: hypothetical protein K6E40_17610 [Desulfovibrio sp.]|nr:hypothetical protein [Desulfovibrio sp.]